MLILKFIVLMTLSASANDGLAPSLSTSSIIPTIITLAPNLHDYGRFADGGPDANWYVGFNNSWIIKLPPAPVGDFARAFIGAKLGRAKTRPVPGKPWLREIIPGKVYAGISTSPSWTSEQSFFLAETSDIPAEADPQAHVDGVGAGEWFWTEVHLAQISFTVPNYLTVWSPTSYFINASSAPILAAAAIDEPDGKTNAWLNRSIQGVPPRGHADSLETPLNTLAPAIAIKLVPPTPDEPALSISDFSVARAGKRVLVRFSVAGEDVSEAWVESSRDQLEWQRISRIQRKPPYLFSLPLDKVPAPGSFLRGTARDISDAIGVSEGYMIPYGPH